MEEVTLFDKVMVVMLVIWLVNLVIPFMILTVDSLLSFWGRKVRSGWYTKYCVKRDNMFGYDYDATESELEFVLMEVLVKGFVLFILGLIIIGLIKLGLPSTWLFILTGGVIALIIIPRFVMDICKATKYSNRTGKLERLDDLEQELLDMQDKIDKLKGDK